MKNGYFTPLALLAGLSAPALAQEYGVIFEHKDWEVVCDNTLACRAAGYSTEDDATGSVLLTREAGPSTLVTGQVRLAEEGTSPAKVTMWVDGQPSGELKPLKDDRWQLSDAQTRKVITAVKGSGRVEFTGGEKPFVLSGSGANAVFLKMDASQGRLDSPGALIKQGKRPESGVFPALEAPVIQRVKVNAIQERPLTALEIAALKPKLLAAQRKDEECELLASPSEFAQPGDNDIILTPVDDHHVLLSTLCWRAAYNEGYGYWVMDSALKGAPDLITTSGLSYVDGVIAQAHKGRGLADCMFTAEWVWDGKTFAHSREARTGMCRYIRTGGTWDLPTFVTDVRLAGEK
ncbi:MAG TPA: DUF1176 domain-containing protein [Enterobacteriaceae bacterium]|nr:DUF1176 domain-containing protein [Enterobacteriaceae bacterium]